MKPDTITEQILAGSRKGDKDYSFDEDHDETRPAMMWFQESNEGKILFIVFYTQACRWSQCLGCNLPSLMSVEHVSFRAIMAQIDQVFKDPAVVKNASRINKVIVSNNGSVLDEATFSSTALMYLIAMMNMNLPSCSVLSMETRPEYVDIEELEFIARGLAEGDTPCQLELAIGFEAFDDRIRNEIFNKGLALDVFEKLVKRMAPYGFRLKTYFMQKPVPGLSDREAVADIQAAIDYLSRISDETKVATNMHLNPTYVATGTALETAFEKGEYTPPLLRDVAVAAYHGKGKPISLYIGLSDEGLAVQGGSFIRPGDEALIRALEKFNQTQDYEILRFVTSE